jgi:hypothetical protein
MIEVEPSGVEAAPPSEVVEERRVGEEPVETARGNARKKLLLLLEEAS